MTGQTLDEMAKAERFIAIEELILSDQLPPARLRSLLSDWPKLAAWLSTRAVLRQASARRAS